MKQMRGHLPAGSTTLPTCRQEHQPSSHTIRIEPTCTSLVGAQRPLVFAALACCLLPGFASLHAQSTFGSVRGIVQDNTSASVPDTTVTLHSTEENTDRVVPADPTGAFIFEP